MVRSQRDQYTYLYPNFFSFFRTLPLRLCPRCLLLSTQPGISFAFLSHEASGRSVSLMTGYNAVVTIAKADPTKIPCIFLLIIDRSSYKNVCDVRLFLV